MVTPYKPVCLNINPSVPLADVPSMFWDTREGKAAVLEALLALILAGYKPQGLKTQMCGQRNKLRAFKRSTVKVMDPGSAELWGSCGCWSWTIFVWSVNLKNSHGVGCQRIFPERIWRSLSNLKNNKLLSADFLFVTLALCFHKLNSCQRLSS